mmetsp:Transcript_10623/g.16103  ORF Transcript_10623/g.16103 Transcript_10623/m.16103 type:complete len:732 (-) Transcript_10623:255-2450(-)
MQAYTEIYFQELFTFQRRVLVMIGDLLIRRGLFDAAEALINENGDWIRHHLDLEIYKSASAVETAILQGDMEIPLQWCLDHASKLRRIDSALEFYVRQEQFLVLVYSGRTIEALQFAQENLAPLVVEKPTDSTTASSAAASVSRSTSHDGGNEVPTPIASGDSAPGSTRSRPRSISLGSVPPNSSSNSRGAGGSRAPHVATPSRSRAVGSSGSTAASTPASTASSSGTHSPSFSFPFSFSANPLAFFHYTHMSPPTSQQPTRVSSTGGSETGRHSQSMQVNRDRSMSISHTDRLVGDPFLSTSSEAGILNAAEQSVYMKEAMCHLMSMLAFVQQAGPAGLGQEKGSKGSHTSPFGSVVPHLYEEVYTNHRRRCMVDLFRLEFRRVYSLPRVCALERYVQLGVFSLKTSSCVAPSSSLSRQMQSAIASTGGVSGASVMSVCAGDSEDPPPMPSLARSTSPGGTVMMNALRMLQAGIGVSSTGTGARVTGATSPQQISSPSSRSHRTSPSASPDTCTGKDPCSTTPTFASLPPSSTSSGCPVCTYSGQVLSRGIPAAARTGSRLRCRGSGKLMDHENPPMALPNGQVYSKAFILSKAFPSLQRKRKSLSSQRERAFIPSPHSESSDAGGMDMEKDDFGSYMSPIDILIGFRNRGGASRQYIGQSEEESKRTEVLASHNDTFPITQIRRTIALTSGGSSSCTSADMGVEQAMFFTCPITKQTYDINQLKPVYIV